ncbi:MAG: DUF4387 family protein [Hasllibacter sp.]
MPELREIARKVRAKNAGPFWLTVDVFCEAGTYARVRDGLSSEAAAKALGVPARTLKRFDLDELHVVKLSCPRPAVQGSAGDRDMHGAAWAEPIASLEIP